MFFKKLLLSFFTLNILHTKGQDISICNSTPNHLWIHCGNYNSGECFDLYTKCFVDRSFICREKWRTLKFYNHYSIKQRCRRRRKRCRVVKCDINIPTLPPTSVPTSNETSIPTSSPSFSPTSVPSFSPTSVPTSKETSVPSFSPTSVPTSKETSVPSSSPTSVPTSKETSVPSSSPTIEPTEENNDEYFLFTLLIVPVIIACLTKPNVCVRWWRIITCWSRRHPNEEDRTEAPPGEDD